MKSLSFNLIVHTRQRGYIKRELHMTESWCPIHYLGVAIGIKRLPLSAFNPLLEKIRGKLSAWKVRTLCFAGKSTLVQSVLQSIPVYVTSSGWVSESFLEKVDGYCRRFLWSKDGDSRGLSLVAWDSLCRLKANGGLGFKKMRPFHEALMGKQLSRFFAFPSSLWARVISHKYRPSANVWEMQPHRAASQAWRAVVGGREVLRQGMQWEVGDGASIKTFDDPWVSNCPLRLS